MKLNYMKEFPATVSKKYFWLIGPWSEELTHLFLLLLSLIPTQLLYNASINDEQETEGMFNGHDVKNDGLNSADPKRLVNNSLAAIDPRIEYQPIHKLKKQQWWISF